jgi:hypothetical protein
VIEELDKGKMEDNEAKNQPPKDCRFFRTKEERKKPP